MTDDKALKEIFAKIIAMKSVTRSEMLKPCYSHVKRTLSAVLCAMSVCCVMAADYPIASVEMTKVRVTGGFWHDRIVTNRTATLKSNWTKCNETPRVANFTNAANRTAGTFGGIPFDDSDVYKVVEGSAYVLASHPDPEIERYVGWFIGEVAKAQEPDGYLYTARTRGWERIEEGEFGNMRANPTTQIVVSKQPVECLEICIRAVRAIEGKPRFLVPQLDLFE